MCSLLRGRIAVRVPLFGICVHLIALFSLFLSVGCRVGAFQDVAWDPLCRMCREFLSSWNSADKPVSEKADPETKTAFDIILEVLSSVYMLEPFKPSEVCQNTLRTSACDGAPFRVA